MKDITMGYAFCGSFCTVKKSLAALEELAKTGIKIKPIMSQIVYTTDTRFGKAEDLIKRVEEICGEKIIHLPLQMKTTTKGIFRLNRLMIFMLCPR